MIKWYLMPSLPLDISDTIITDIGPSPFENFYLGGSGMTGYSLYGREIIALRGYTDGSVTPTDPENRFPDR